MSENIDWIQVVIDYGKRFPDVTTLDIGLIGAENVKLSTLQIANSVKTLRIEKLYVSQFDYIIRLMNNKSLCYWWGGNNSRTNILINRTWVSVPQHTLLRLLTEGKEDLV